MTVHESVMTLPLRGETKAKTPFWNIFFEPAVTLAAQKERPRYWAPLLIGAVLPALVNHYVMLRVGFKQLVMAAIAASGSLDPDAIAQNAFAHKNQILEVQAISTFLGSIVTVFVVATVLWLTALVIGAEGSFAQVLAVIAHVNLFVWVIRDAMLATVVTVGRNPDAFDLRNPLGTNLAFYVHPDSRALMRLLGSADIVVAAALALTIIGLHLVMTRLSVKNAALIVLVPFAMYVLAGVWLPWL